LLYKHLVMNSLINETSPYLLQHAHNPVNWYPWKKEILEKAQKENKLILVSIGYAACHWCHVMEKECFEDDEVAQIMNKLFINIKVDREERPDVDHFYMDAMQLMNGHGGWPLNCICLPDGTPIFAATYVPKKRWIEIIQKVYDYVHRDYEKAKQIGKNVIQGIQYLESTFHLKKQTNINESHFQEIIKNLLKRVDFKNGGFSGAPKFPTPINWLFLLRISTILKNSEIDTAVLTTLTQMAHGGIYDHVGGGFARYSVDEYWKVPHFEKMLYDNAQMIQLYAEAYQKFKLPLFKSVVYETIGFLLRELYSPENAFYSSLDADSEGIEGKFYLWSYDELQNILQDDFLIFSEIFNIQKNGNWEHNLNILHLTEYLEDVLRKYNLTNEIFYDKMKLWKKMLLNARNQRIRPQTDDKIILSWNAMAIQSFAYASRVFNEPFWLNIAKSTYDFIFQKMKSNNDFFFRTYKNQYAKIDAFLEDYVTLADAARELFVSTGDEKYLKHVFQIYEVIHNFFYDDKTNVFSFSNHDFNEILVNKTELYDSVIPSSNSMVFNLLYTIYHIEWDSHYLQMIENIVLQLLPLITNYPSSHANWAWLLTKMYYGQKELIITGSQAEFYVSQIDQNFYHPFLLKFPLKKTLPWLLFNGKMSENLKFYLCKNGNCELPFEQWEDLLKSLDE